MWDLSEMTKSKVTRARQREIDRRDLQGLCIHGGCESKQTRLGCCDHHYRRQAKKWAGAKNEVERQLIIAKLASEGLLISSRQGQWLDRERKYASKS
jgi:hypothetical protein